MYCDIVKTRKSNLSKILSKYNINYKNAFFDQHSDWFDINKKENEENIAFILNKNKKIYGYQFFKKKKIEGYYILSATAGPRGSLGGGKVYNSKYDFEIKQKLINEIEKYCQKNNIAVCTLFSDPLDKDHQNIIKIFKPSIIYRNFTQIIDLKKKINRKNNLNKYKNHINFSKDKIKLIKANYSNENLNIYKNIHNKFLKIKNYKLPNINIIEELLKKTNKKNLHLFFLKKNKKIIASSICLRNNKNITNFLTLNPEQKKIKNQIFINLILNFYKKKNYKYFNWQSSKKINDGTFIFKKEYGSDLLYYFILTKFFIKKSIFLKNLKYFTNDNDLFLCPFEFLKFNKYNISYIK